MPLPEAAIPYSDCASSLPDPDRAGVCSLLLVPVSRSSPLSGNDMASSEYPDDEFEILPLEVVVAVGGRMSLNDLYESTMGIDLRLLRYSESLCAISHHSQRSFTFRICQYQSYGPRARLRSFPVSRPPSSLRPQLFHPVFQHWA